MRMISWEFFANVKKILELLTAETLLQKSISCVDMVDPSVKTIMH